MYRFHRRGLLGAGLIAALVAPAAARAQSVDIPLNLEQGSGGVILTINVGIDGGQPRPYLFDTGSQGFNAFYSASAFGGLSSTSSTLPQGVQYKYGDAGKSSATYYGNLIQTPSLSFYSSLTGSAAATLTSAGSPGFVMTAVTSAVNGQNQAITAPLKANGSFDGYYGIFGASTEVLDKSGQAVGSILGQAVIPGTSAGYVVAANGEPLSSLGANIKGQYLNGPQVGQSITACSPCVIEGLTPSVLAQFSSANTMSVATAGLAFPTSSNPSFNNYDVNATVTIKEPGKPAFTVKEDTLFDSGTPNIGVYSQKPGLPASPLPAGSTVTIAGAAGSTPTTFLVRYAASGAPTDPYDVVTGKATTNYVGVSFFLQNSVLFNLAGQAVAYSPNFVTDAAVSTAAGALRVNSSSVPLGLAGVISGPDGVIVENGGSATLSAANTYKGPTTVAGGFLALVGPGDISSSSGLTVSAGGVFDISGVANAEGRSALASLSGDSTGVVALGANSLALSHANGTFAGTIAGAGGLELIGGTETLTGVNAYAGATSILGGRLIVDGSIASSALTIVGPSATLAGVGAVGPLAVEAGGVVAPGHGAASGALSVAGNLVFAPGSTYLVELGDGASSSVKASGTATLTGATLVGAAAPGAALSTRYAILSASGGLGGTTFGKIVSPSPNYAETLTYSAHGVDLNLQPTLGAGTPLPSKAQAVASAINTGLTSTGALPASISAVYAVTGPELAASLAELGGEAPLSAERAGFALGDDFLNIMLDPYVAGRDATPVASHWSLWGAAYGGGANGDGESSVGSASVSATSFGYAAGADDRLSPHALVGFALAGGGADWSVGNGLGSGRSTALQVGVYGIAQSGPAYLSAALAFTNQWLATNRSALGDPLTASFNAEGYGGRLEGGYRFDATPTLGVTPYGAVQVQDYEAPSFRETDVLGAGSGLAYGASTAVDTRTELGARFDARASVGDAPVTVFARLAWAHDFVDAPSATAAFEALPGSTFTVYGAPLAQNSVLASAGARLSLGKGWTLQAKFEGQLAGGASDFGGAGTLIYNW